MADFTVRDKINGEYEDEYKEIEFDNDGVTIRDGRDFIQLTHEQVDQLYNKKEVFKACAKTYGASDNNE